MIKTLFPVCQIVIVFTAKVNEDEEGAMDTICNANEGAGRIAFRKQYQHISTIIVVVRAG